MQTRRAFLGTASIFSAFALLRFVPGCGDASTSGPPAPTTGRKPTDDDEYVPQKPADPGPPEQSKVGDPAWEAKAKELEAANVGGVVYTETAPGPFAGKERSHVPQLTVQSDGVAVILVAGPDGGSDGGKTDAGDAGPKDGGDAGDAGYVDSGIRPQHYVTTIYAKDDKGRVVFMKELKPTDAAPPFIAFKIPAGATALKAFEHCNLHGVWSSAESKVG
jgi:hypothetical protein